ncbi:unnamed protein product, partial [Bubo scandiacus]
SDFGTGECYGPEHLQCHHMAHMGQPGNQSQSAWVYERQPVKVPLDGILSLKYIKCTTQLGVICKFAKGALKPTVSSPSKMLNSAGPNTNP